MEMSKIDRKNGWKIEGFHWGRGKYSKEGDLN